MWLVLSYPLAQHEAFEGLESVVWEEDLCCILGSQKQGRKNKSRGPVVYLTWKTPLRLNGEFNFHVSCSMATCCGPSCCVYVAAFVLRVRRGLYVPLSNHQIRFGALAAVAMLTLVVLMPFFGSRPHWSELEEQSAL